MRRHVAPAEPTASIPDPDRGGFLPVGGREVSWSPHWAGLAAREEISVADVADVAEPPVTAPPVPESGEAHEAHPDA